MSRRNMGRAPNGSGTIRPKKITRQGKTYTYWEVRYTDGYKEDGRQNQRSKTFKTMAEAARFQRKVTSEIDSGTYTAPDNRTTGQWLDVWFSDYLPNVKPRTAEIYEMTIRVHIKPRLGDIKLQTLSPEDIQKFYNCLTKEKALSPKTVKDVHGVLHKALKQAVLNGYIKNNPSENCVLPRSESKEITPLSNTEIAAFIAEIEQDSLLHPLFLLGLLTGMREGELMGLTWDCVDLQSRTLVINKQLFRFRGENGGYRLVPTKNGKARGLVLSSSAVAALELQKGNQARLREQMGSEWEVSKLVFTDEFGHHLTNSRVYRHFKRIVARIGRPDARFHDLRHSYAVLSLQAGDDIKTLQNNLGHATASFTLDRYGHATDDMKQASADRLEAFVHKLVK